MKKNMGFEHINGTLINCGCFYLEVLTVLSDRTGEYVVIAFEHICILYISKLWVLLLNGLDNFV